MPHTDPKDNQILKLQKDNERLKKQLTKFGKDKYGLFWFDVPEGFENDVENMLPILKEVPKLAIKSKDDKPTHILIEGDNYHALTCLNYTHKSKIDVIYIDPPYNTGSDGFKYKDKRFLDKYPDGTEVPSDHPLRHSYWLSFIRKRLELARDILKETGVIFISIDDNELAQLKLLCNEIFKENNFIITITTKRSSAAGHKTINPTPVNITEYILVYAKNKSKWIYTPQYIECEYDDMYDLFVKNIQNPPEKWKILKLSEVVAKELNFKNSKEAQKKIGKGFKEEIANFALKNAKQVFRFTGINYDGVGKETQKFYDLSVKNPDKIYYQKRKGYPNIYIKNRNRMTFYYPTKVKELNGKLIPTELLTNLWTDIGWHGIAKEGGITFNKGKKPIKLIKRIVNLATNDKNALILDFFAGSGTTGEAVMNLNKEDGKNRQFILITNNEEFVNGENHKIMTDMCYPRIKNSIKGYNNKKALGNSIKYYKTAFVGKNSILNADDKDKIELAHNAGSMLAIAENTLEEIKKNNYYQIFENGKQYTAIYFKEEFDKFDNFIKIVKSLKKPVAVYIFSWEKELDVPELEDLKNITIKTIPQPILEIYKRIYNLI